MTRLGDLKEQIRQLEAEGATDETPLADYIPYREYELELNLLDYLGHPYISVNLNVR